MARVKPLRKSVPLPAIERARAALRLHLDRSPLVPVVQLHRVAGTSAAGLIRWIVTGRSGVHLDAVQCPVRGWLSTEPALKRFFKQWAAKTNAAET